MKRALIITGLVSVLAGVSSVAQADTVDIAQVKCSEFIQDKQGMGMS